MINSDIRPLGSARQARPNGFQNRLLGGKSRRQMRCRVHLGKAIHFLHVREASIQKPVAMLSHHPVDAFDLDNIHAMNQNTGRIGWRRHDPR